MNKFSFVAALAFTWTMGGCSMLKPPDAEPVPPKPKAPPVDLFAPDDNVTHGAALPGTYSIVGVDASSDPDSNEVVIVRSVSMVKGADGKETPVPGTVTEKMRLAGIILPPKGARGRDSAVHAINGWTFGKTDLTIEGDSQYPTDLQGRRLVQIYFMGQGGDWKGKPLNLNRMLVRGGFAVVDLNQATSVNTQKWFNDEQYARLRTDPADKEHKKPAPLGLWKMGIILGQRPPVPKVKKDAATPVPAPAGGVTAPIGGTADAKPGAPTPTPAP